MSFLKKITASFILAIVVAAGISPPPEQAQAVSWGYCYDSLRGKGSLAPDHDVQIKVNQFEAQGKNVTSTAHAGWLGDGDGGYRVVELVQFNFANGSGAVRGFECYGSGSGYHDAWAGY